MPASPCCTRDGLIVLPPRRSTRVLRPSRDRTAAGPRPSGSSAAYPSTKEGKLWNACHYLGFTPMPGAQHFVRSAKGEPLAVLGFGAAAWKTAPQVHRLGAPPAHLSSSTTRGYCPGSESNILHPMSSHRSSDVCSTTGTAVTLCVQHCLRPFAKALDSRELATVQPTGSGSAKHRAAASST